MPRLAARWILAAAGAAPLFSAPARAADPPTYQCVGFAEPMNRSPQRIPRGRVLPLMAKLKLPDGTFANAKTLSSPPALTLKYKPAGAPEVDKTSGMEVRDYGKGDRFVWDDEAHWKFDLGTGNQPEDGEYVATLVSGDEKAYKVDPQCSIVFNLQGGGGGGKER
jgi:hypothetical protein